ncbi:MAG: ABC transporter substrate-binding protein [Ignavibacteriaceae bacterium]|nr:ABC transporter substrate-binding protein [Ignavibacteriaceae bacterium]
MMVKLKYFLIVSLLLLLSTATFSQNAENINTEFKLAVNLYDAFQYKDALKIFDRITSYESKNSKTTAAYLFKAKTMVKLERLPEAIETINRLMSVYPATKYLDEARLTLADIYFEQKDYYEALKPLISLIDETQSTEYLSYAKVSGEKIAYNYLPSSLIRVLNTLYSGEKVSPYIMFLLGKVYQKEADLQASKQTFEELIRKYPNSPEKGRALELLSGGANTNLPGVTITTTLIGAMLPLSGVSLTNDQTDAAKEILEGIRYSIFEYNEEHQEKIGLITKDTELSKEKIDEIKKYFTSLQNVKAVIGPVFSTEVRTALQEFNGNDLPIISPTATDNDLTGLYNNFFQANSTFTLRGKLMAQYVYYVENKRRMAILNAIEGYSPLLAGEFQQEFEKLGGMIVIKETYSSNTFDLSSQIGSISKLHNNIEGIYIPLASKVDVPAILSEMVRNNLNIAVYGNQDWLLASGFETSPEISNKITFTSDYFIDFNNPGYKAFSKRFNDVTGLDPNRNVFYGYDTGKYLLTVLRNINTDRESIKMKMESGIISSGFHNNISFDDERVNKFLNIVRYKDGKFELIDKFKSGK